MTPQEARKQVLTVPQMRELIRELTKEDQADVGFLHQNLQDAINRLSWFMMQVFNRHASVEDHNTKVQSMSMADLQKAPDNQDLKLYMQSYRQAVSAVQKTLANQQAKNMLDNSRKTAGISVQELINSVLVSVMVNAGAQTGSQLESQLDNEFDRAIKRAEPVSRSAKRLGATSPKANVLKAFRRDSNDALANVNYGDNRKKLKRNQRAFTDYDMLGNDWHTSLWDNISGLIAGYNQDLQHKIVQQGGLRSPSPLWSEADLNDVDDLNSSTHKYISNLDTLIPSQKQTVNNKAVLAVGISFGVKYWSLITMNDLKVCKYCDAAAMDNPHTFNQIIRNNWYPLVHLHCRCQWQAEVDQPIYFATGLPKKKQN